MYCEGTPHRRHPTYAVDMDNRSEVREFLMSRRAKLTPEQAGLPAGPNRRVAGLRRTEVAVLAGVSVEYYSKLERGTIAGASSAVLDAIANALQLDDTERAHLFDLARAADGIPTSGRAAQAHRPPGTGPSQPQLDARVDHRRDRVRPQPVPGPARDERRSAARSTRRSSATAAARRTSPGSSSSTRPPGSSIPTGSSFAEMCVAIMRAEAGRNPHDRAMQDLVGELSTQSETFRRLWGAHDVRTHGAGTKRFTHPVVGELTFAYEEFAITSDPGLVMLVYTVEPGSPSAERLALLGSWAASHPVTAGVAHRGGDAP